MKRREIRVQYLIEAYRRIESASSRTLSDSEDGLQHARNMEDALGDIQLFGNREQVKSTTDVIESLAAPPNKVDLDPLLMILRRDLRLELRLEPLEGTPRHLRIKPKHQAKPSSVVILRK